MLRTPYVDSMNGTLCVHRCVCKHYFFVSSSLSPSSALFAEIFVLLRIVHFFSLSLARSIVQSTWMWNNRCKVYEKWQQHERKSNWNFVTIVYSLRMTEYTNSKQKQKASKWWYSVVVVFLFAWCVFPSFSFRADRPTEWTKGREKSDRQMYQNDFVSFANIRYSFMPLI